MKRHIQKIFWILFVCVGLNKAFFAGGFIVRFSQTGVVFERVDAASDNSDSAFALKLFDAFKLLPREIRFEIYYRTIISSLKSSGVLRDSLMWCLQLELVHNCKFLCSSFSGEEQCAWDNRVVQAIIPQFRGPCFSFLTETFMDAGWYRGVRALIDAYPRIHPAGVDDEDGDLGEEIEIASLYEQAISLKNLPLIRALLASRAAVPEHALVCAHESKNDAIRLLFQAYVSPAAWNAAEQNALI